ncbi:NAD(P)/FAD-dependent oxidoreductase [Candidatus Omnitrophota bacterium]
MKQIVIIGDSAAGVAAVEAIRKKDTQTKIIVLSDEAVPSYCRCVISDYLAGKVDEDKLVFRSKAFFTENNVELLLNKKVIKVDPKKNRIVAEDISETGEGEPKKKSSEKKVEYNYDMLLLANGASPKFPDTKGIKKRGVFGFRTIKDARGMIEASAIADTACVLGGGLIGLKAASGLKKRDLDVRVVIRSPHVLSQVLDEQAAEFFQKRLAANGVEVLTGKSVAEIVGNGDVKAVRLDSGKVIACQIVVAAKGVAPNVKIIKETEIKIDEGVCVDDTLKTNIPNIYAAGDVCQAYDITLGKPQVNALWPNAVEQGKIAGYNISGEAVKYEGSIGMNSVEFFDLPMVSMGVYKQGDNHEVLTKIRPEKEEYKKLVIDGNRLVGAILVGDIAQSGVFLRLIREKTDINAIRNELLHENFSYANIKELVKEEDRIYV